jgi:hypothetical protein
VLLCEDIDRIFDCVCRDDLGVVPSGLGRCKVTSEQSRDVDFLDRVDRAIAKNFEDADGRLAVALADQFRHCVQ